LARPRAIVVVTGLLPMPPRDQPLVVLPQSDAERPPWAKVGIIAAAGFIVGIAWPTLAGMRVAPNPPGEGGATSTPNRPVTAPIASTQPAQSAAAASSAAAPAPTASVSVGQGFILSCGDTLKDKRKECGSLAFDPIAVPKIKSLARCPAAAGVTGKLSIGFEIDFRRKTVRPQLGKSTSLERDSAEALIRCAEPMFESLALWEVPHEHRRYTVFYSAELAAPGKAAAADSEPAAPDEHVAGTTTGESPASGMATIGWDVALVRDAPKNGSVVGRILQGSKVKLVGRQGDWYHVQFRSIDGWVHRGAIGTGSSL
jgi:Bacterial SH3 domain